MSRQWIYTFKLFRTAFQAKVAAKRIEENYWIDDHRYSPQEIEVFRTLKGRFGVRYYW